MANDLESIGEAKKNRFVEHIIGDDEITLLTLKGHLLVEEELDEIIRNKCRSPEHLGKVGFPFYAKARLARALVGGDAPVWGCIDALNSLRNELAHKLQSQKLQGKLRNFIDLVAMADPDREQGDTDEYNLGLSIVYVHASIARIGANVRIGTTSRGA